MNALEPEEPKTWAERNVNLRRKGERLSGWSAGRMERRQILAGGVGVLVPNLPRLRRGRQEFKGCSSLQGRLMARMADRAAVIAIPVVVGMDSTGGCCLEAYKAGQDNNDEREAEERTAISHPCVQILRCPA
jgi:hypothetical protein